jgi:hypothetical protein
VALDRGRRVPWKRTTVGSKCVRVPGECITSRARRAARLPAPTEGAGRADPPSSEALDDGVGELAATDHLAVSLAGSIERGDCRSQLRGGVSQDTVGPRLEEPEIAFAPSEETTSSEVRATLVPSLSSQRWSLPALQPDGSWVRTKTGGPRIKGSA